ncbi:MAG: formimidoylglutamate deiminase [bacterium]
MTEIHARTALLPEGWAKDVLLQIDKGRVTGVTTRVKPRGYSVDCLLPAPVNLHSHTFQRAMAGLTERRSAGQDSFWTWRTLMYRFLDQLTPDDVQAIAAMVMMEMAEAGYAGIAEFHYLHHGPNGNRYGDLAEMSSRIAAAAADTGLGLTHLPVLYERGGCDGRALTAGQQRFGNTPDQFAALWQAAQASLKHLPPDTVLGVAPHSLRAASAAGLTLAASLSPTTPIHIHVAEQVAEVEEVQAATGQRPVDWLMAHHEVGERWCLIHATQMTAAETLALARSRAIAGLCPITEANLGDGIFDGQRYLAAAGRFGVGSDSNVRISLTEELRLLEYSQRLGLKGRAILATADRSTGRTLYEGAVQGGAQAAGRAAGAIAIGQWADLLALDLSGPDLMGAEGDTILDTFLFARDDRTVTDLWSAGRHLVRAGRHHAHDRITASYAKTVTRLRGAL